MQRQEVKQRFFLSRCLTYLIVLIMALFAYKYAIESYRLFFKDHVSVDAETGQSATDDVLLAAFFLFFMTLLHVSLTYQVDPNGASQRASIYLSRSFHELKSLESGRG